MSTEKQEYLFIGVNEDHGAFKMSLPNDELRCDGLLPKLTQYEGKPMILWAHDCPVRDECRRFLAMEAEAEHYNPRAIYNTHQHAPGDECPDFLQETNDDNK